MSSVSRRVAGQANRVQGDREFWADRCSTWAKAYTALQDLVVTAPAALREQLAGLHKDRLFHACEQLPEPETLTSPTDAVTVTIKSLAARCRPA
jgi:hypothetical protein